MRDMRGKRRWVIGLGGGGGCVGDLGVVRRRCVERDVRDSEGEGWVDSD